MTAYLAPSSARGGYVHAVETFGAVDGPGLRYVLFTAGCRMRCLYCHNPDTWTLRDGQYRTVDEVVEEIGRYATFYKRTGGLTVSGGEPLLRSTPTAALPGGCRMNGSIRSTWCCSISSK